MFCRQFWGGDNNNAVAYIAGGLVKSAQVFGKMLIKCRHKMIYLTHERIA